MALGGWQDVAVLLSLLYREEQREGWVAGQHLTSAALCFLLPCADPGMLCAFCCPVPIQGCFVLSAALCRSRDALCFLLPCADPGIMFPAAQLPTDKARMCERWQ